MRLSRRTTAHEKPVPQDLRLLLAGTGVIPGARDPCDLCIPAARRIFRVAGATGHSIPACGGRV